MVVARTGGEKVTCKVRGRRLEVVAGDVVCIKPDPVDDDWTVTDRLDRRNVLRRSDSRGLDESIAANLDQLAIVVAPRPPSDPFIADRYLAGAAYAGIAALLVVNKQDLPADERNLDFVAELESTNLPVYRVSARSGASLADLQSALTGRRTLFAGQSGVGKSSLFNTLCGSDVRATRTLSDASGEGRHTTVSSAILTLPWGELVDTPGVRDYAPATGPAEDRAGGLRRDHPPLRVLPVPGLSTSAGARLCGPHRRRSWRRFRTPVRELSASAKFDAPAYKSPRLADVVLV